MKRPGEIALRRFDMLAIGAGVFFVLAVALAAYPAIKAGPATLGGMLLLAGLTAVAGLGIFAFRPAEIDVESASESLLGAIDEPAAIAGLDGRIIAANPAWREAIGPTRRLPAAVSTSELFAAVSEAGRTGRAEIAVRGKDASRAASLRALPHDRLLVRLAPIAPAPAASPAPSAAVHTGPLEIDSLAGAAPFGAAMIEGADLFEGLIVEANAALRAMAGHAAGTGRPFGALIEDGSRAELAAALAAGKIGPFEVRLAGEAARIVHLYLTRTETRFVAYLIDVSQQKQMELQLFQSQKMQAIGQLAGGVAHDLNNLLTAILMRLNSLAVRHPVGDPSYEDLTEIGQTCARAADLVRKLLTFSRKQTVQRVTLDVGELISESQVLLRRLLPEHVKLVTHYGRDLPKVRADKSELETAVMNLVVNARDAVKPRGADGVVTITTARLTYEEAVLKGYADPTDNRGELAMIEVSDNGPGVPPEVRARIFEPFFTTKAQGEGTGLGLSTVYGIVKTANGWIEIADAPGGGAAFRVFIPVYVPAPGEEAAQVAAAAAKLVRPAPRDLSGVGRILFVEDEDAVRVIAAKLLRDRGYEVIEAADGEEALIIAEENAGAIDLLISDVIMPGMDGPTLLKKARGYLGNAPVMFISGYAESDFSDLLEGEEGVTFLAKPIDIKTLAEKVKQQLGAG